MSNFKNWQKAKHELSLAKSWLSNKDKKDHHDKLPYSLKVKLGREAFQYCGQSHSGANNYHSSEQSFNAYIEKSIKNNRQKIFEDAIHLMEKDCDDLGVAAKSEIESMLEEIESIAST